MWVLCFRARRQQTLVNAQAVRHTVIRLALHSLFSTSCFQCPDTTRFCWSALSGFDGAVLILLPHTPWSSSWVHDVVPASCQCYNKSVIAASNVVHLFGSSSPVVHFTFMSALSSTNYYPFDSDAPAAFSTEQKTLYLISAWDSIVRSSLSYLAFPAAFIVEPS